jgi:hypothetical protein
VAVKPSYKTLGRKYVQRYDGEPFEVKTAFIDRCCDCGLVHINKLVVRGRRIFMTSWRDNKRTANSRRGKRFKCRKRS